MKSNLLENLIILDFTARLPGPYATMILADMGAQIIKCENLTGDAFNDAELNLMAPNFKDWYKNLNHNKEVLKLDFKKDREQIKKLTMKSDIILYPQNSFFNQFISELALVEKTLIEIAAGQGVHKSLHDINILALSETFKLHRSDLPPYLPFAGMAFGQYISSFILAARGSKTKHTLYMKDVVIYLFDALNSAGIEKKQFLHNGVFAAYGLYTSLDKKNICLAAMEEKFWLKFIELFELPLKSEDRFDRSGAIRGLLQDLFSNMSSNEIQEIVKDNNICLTIEK